MLKKSLWMSCLVLVTACGQSPEAHQKESLAKVKQLVTTQLNELHTAAVALQTAAPAADADGWNATQDAAAVQSMKAEWKKARIAYERIEGAIAVLFPTLDVATDERYDGFIATDADNNLFDGEGVTGIHAIERILWSDSIPARVQEFEQALTYYKAAAFPANATEAQDFKEKLAGQLVADIQQMRTEFEPLALDTAAAFRGVVGSMEEQLEKTNLAATGEEESRYAQHTLADMRANVEGGLSVYEAFRPWIQSVGGSEEDTAIVAGLKKIQAKYDTITGDALPAVPNTWSSVNPSNEDLNSPFGQLFVLLRDESDPDKEGSTVHFMNHAAERVGIPQLPEE